MNKIGLVLFLSLFMSSTGYASSSEAVLVTHVIQNIKKGIFQFKHDGAARTSPPSCGSGDGNKWAIDASTNEGRAALSVLLTAYSLGKRVSVYGTGDCTVSMGNVSATTTDAEVVSFFIVLP